MHHPSSFCHTSRGRLGRMTTHSRNRQDAGQTGNLSLWRAGKRWLKRAGPRRQWLNDFLMVWKSRSASLLTYCDSRWAEAGLWTRGRVRIINPGWVTFKIRRKRGEGKGNTESGRFFFTDRDTSFIFVVFLDHEMPPWKVCRVEHLYSRACVTHAACMCEYTGQI